MQLANAIGVKILTAKSIDVTWLRTMEGLGWCEVKEGGLNQSFIQKDLR